VGIRLGRAYDSAATVCVKTFIYYMRVIIPAPDVLAADVFGTGIFH
jgi:hypothetical protein